MNTNNPTAYIFFDNERDWECRITTNPKNYEGMDDWYLGGIIHSISELFELMDNHGFDYEYIYLFLEEIPHWLYNELNKGAN